MASSDAVRPELTALTDEQKRRVRGRLRRKRARCRACGTRMFQVGDALYLGFLFRSEAHDAYLVALTCENSACPAPHTGISLREREFLSG